MTFVKEEHAKRALDIIQNDPLGSQAEIIGRVKKSPEKTVNLKTKIGTDQILDMLSGEQLPRIC
ncbi:MAG: hypothetical protein F3744_12110 [Nitrospinae bacterium]|nr:hypothetical protein [Nitrospinota bacterium]